MSNFLKCIYWMNSLVFSFPIFSWFRWCFTKSFWPRNEKGKLYNACFSSYGYYLFLKHFGKKKNIKIFLSNKNPRYVKFEIAFINKYRIVIRENDWCKIKKKEKLLINIHGIVHQFFGVCIHTILYKHQFYFFF